MPDEAPAEPQMTLAQILDGCKVHHAEAPTDHSLILTLRKGRKQHIIKLSFDFLTVERMEVKRVQTTDRVAVPMNFK